MKKQCCPRNRNCCAPRCSINVRELGQAFRVEYRRPGQKLVRLHQFGKGVRLLVANDGKTLIIAGGRMRVRGGEIRG